MFELHTPDDHQPKSSSNETQKNQQFESPTPPSPDRDQELLNTELNFKDSVTAQESMHALQQVGLPLKWELLSRFSEENDKNHRYGNGFASLSRYSINVFLERKSAYERLGQFFEDLPEVDPDIETWEEYQKAASMIAEQIQKKLAQIETDQLHPPAAHILKLIQQVCGVNSRAPDTEGVVLLNDGRSARDGSCKDTETYYATALSFPNAEFYGSKKLDIMKSQSGDPFLLVKSNFGVDTSLTLRPIVIQGVEFPTGTVVRCVQQPDGTIAIRPLRATAFSFDTPQMMDAFGSQALTIQKDTQPKGVNFFELHARGWLNRVHELFPEVLPQA